ncbi:eukaryotic membrane protein family-domain-containing protein [Scenedesmus sp. NREL 46B-D3]|nr:eukaryotic membrane protein family-domain-containing protein [Scenedesmus sp. NREL 46B-D3]
MKDITSEFLKIQLIFTALEILDKILSNFGVDVLEALSSTCTLFTRHSIGLGPLASDLLVAFLLITAHGGVLMCQAMVFAVTMNSKANALLALMIATNFVELKGQVYKRTDTNKLWTLACQDIVERFELLLVLCFVVVEDISNGGCWVPAAATLLVCGRIFFWEIIIDIAKHAVLGKFNDIRPGIYREYMRDLCVDSLDHHSHNMHKLVGFCPMGPAALCLRMLHTLFTLKGDGPPQWHLRAAFLLVAWLAACVLQVVVGFSLKWLAYLYVRHHAALAGGKSLPRAINVTPAGAKLVPAAAAAAKPGIGVAPAAVGTAAAAGVTAGAAAAGGGGGTTATAGAAGGTGSVGQAAAGAASLQSACAKAADVVNVRHSRSDEGQNSSSWDSLCCEQQ